ncbi:hypothetical protein DXU92_04040 [Brachybacterium saurashtrense]|uniref:Uncharacterized protein n=1 Tax=Brachybacterium saurashtrense TaxID=556288 RepID=A0A345YQW0_9MICO|nr:hypothetical protein DWV08_12290 [Brachybacterium saurashtrense]RRR24052.1 hypothetical protein DXU92_04040 [Brachybacterium saurashtrense]
MARREIRGELADPPAGGGGEHLDVVAAPEELSHRVEVGTDHDARAHSAPGRGDLAEAGAEDPDGTYLWVSPVD